MANQKGNRKMATFAAPAVEKTESIDEQLERLQREAEEMTTTTRGTRDEINRAKLDTFAEWANIRRRAAKVA